MILIAHLVGPADCSGRLVGLADHLGHFVDPADHWAFAGRSVVYDILGEVLADRFGQFVADTLWD